MSMDVQFKSSVNVVNAAFDGKISNRTQNDGRDVFFASGNIDTSTGMPKGKVGQFTTNGSVVTSWMEGKHDGEDKVIKGRGAVIFAGPNAEEVGGVLTISPKDGKEYIGFIGKR